MKKYNSRFYDNVDKALEDCNNHQDWNVINIYRTGWREEVGIVYYICTDTLKQEWSEKYIAEVFEKVGLAKIVRDQSNDNLTNALQDAMIELSKFTPTIRT